MVELGDPLTDLREGGRGAVQWLKENWTLETMVRGYLYPNGVDR
jgi:hypothetical protein